MKFLLGTDDEYQTLYVDKKIFLSEILYFHIQEIFFWMQIFINEAHQPIHIFFNAEKKNSLCFSHKNCVAESNFLIQKTS